MRATAETAALDLPLFVYGTLAPGRKNHHRLRRLAGLWQPAQVRGQIWPRGFAQSRGYPLLVYGGTASTNQAGWLLHSPDLHKALPALDRFEGSAYQRISVTVRSRRQKVQAWVYVATESPINVLRRSGAKISGQNDPSSAL